MSVALSVLPRREPRAGISLVAALGRALHEAGAPAHQLEQSMESVAARLGLRGQFFVTPTAIYLSFQGDDGYQTVLLRSDSGDVDLERLARLDGLVRGLYRGRLTAEEVQLALDEPRTTPYAGWLTWMAHVVASAAAACFFGGGWREILVAGAGAGLVATLGRWAQRSDMVSRLHLPLSAFLVTSLAAVAARWMPPVSIAVATLGGLIVLVPGLTLTVSLTELATRHLVSGVARLAGAGAMFLLIGLGFAFGEQVAQALGVGAAAPLPLPVWTEWVALLVSPLAFLVLFRAPVREVGWVMAAGLVAFLSARWGTRLFTPELGVFCGAFLVGLGANLYERLRDRPASTTVVPGIMLLVPGSLGFRGLSLGLSRDIVGGLESVFLMLMVGIALATGLVLANVVLPPGGWLRAR